MMREDATSQLTEAVLHPPGEAPGGARMACPFYTCEHEFRLVPEAHADQRR